MTLPANPALDYLIARAEQGTRHDATLTRLRELHQPVERDGPTPRCCRACVAGYDPPTRQLVFCAWPCPTMAIIEDSPR